MLSTTTDADVLLLEKAKAVVLRLGAAVRYDQIGGDAAVWGEPHSADGFRGLHGEAGSGVVN